MKFCLDAFCQFFSSESEAININVKSTNKVVQQRLKIFGDGKDIFVVAEGVRDFNSEIFGYCGVVKSVVGVFRPTSQIESETEILGAKGCRRIERVATVGCLVLLQDLQFATS